MIGIIDYGVGNLFSLSSSFTAIGEEVFISADKDMLNTADKLILPGVGAFGDAIRKLKDSGLDEFVKEKAASGTPLLGICLGMQLLFEKSFEYGEHDGLGLLKGAVMPMSKYTQTLKLPHMGWNKLHITNENSRLMKNTSEGEHVYFVHSFCAIGCEDSLAAVSEYGFNVTAAVEKGNVYGCQFHPEKSGEAGLKILKAFCKEGQVVTE